MLKILIVDDNISKQESIKKTLNEDSNVPFEDMIVACCSKDAKKDLYQTRFDLMILDLVLPIEGDGEAEAKNGARLLQEISTNPSIKPPLHIVGLSGFRDLVSEYDNQFKEKLWNLINYESDSYEWQSKLNSIVQHLIKVRQDFLNASLENQLDGVFEKLKSQNYPVAFLGHDWKTICKSIIDIVERSLEVPSKFSKKAKNINLNTVKIESEYDFQNLIHLVLRPWLPSMEAENIAIIFDSSSKIADFSINANSIIIEAKHIKDTNTRNTVMKTIEGLKNFYQGNANVKSLIFLLLVEDSVDIDKHKIENEFSIFTKEPYVFVSVIINKLK
ncbi:MAG: response regulator [Cytophagales bacterium]|nr:MAG: response regulator [Cytophagales bacterium]